MKAQTQIMFFTKLGIHAITELLQDSQHCSSSSPTLLDFLDLGLLARTTLAEFWDSVDKKQTGQEVTMFVYVYKNKKLKKKKKG